MEATHAYSRPPAVHSGLEEVATMSTRSVTVYSSPT